MSDGAFTDSTTPRLENWRTVAPFSGSSTKTTSPSCSCAKCVMPIVATSPSARTHSCSLEYLRSSGTVLTLLSPCCTSGSLRSPPAVSSLRSSTVKRCLHYRSGNVLAANADPQCRPDLRKGRRDVGQGDVLLDRRSVGAARDATHDRSVLRDLEAVLAGVPGAGQRRARAGHAAVRDAEGWERPHVGVCLRGEDVRGARSLDGDESRCVRAIVERDIFIEVRDNMCAVFRDVRRVHDHHVFAVADPVDDHVVDDRASLVGQQAVPCLTDGETRDVARDDAVESRAGAATLEEELAHVREVEEAGVVPNRAMLRDDALVLDWHLEAREKHHLRPELS